MTDRPTAEKRTAATSETLAHIFDEYVPNYAGRLAIRKLVHQAEAAAVEREREECAKVADDWFLTPEDENHDNNVEPQQGDGTSHNKACRYIAKAIRARGKP